MIAAGASHPGPYRGLNPFGDDELDALLFFGREREREIVVANLIASRLTVLYGPSGVGKSSLLRAGAARALRGLPERPVVVVFSSWAEDPAAELTAAVCEEAGVPSAAVLDEALTAVGERDVYLILDQAEEYFLYHRDGETAFELQLASTIREPARVNVLLSLREDALAQLDRFQGRIPNLFGNALRLDRLDRSSGEAAIVGPVDRWNELEGTAIGVEPALVAAVLDEVGAGRIEHGIGGRGAVDANGHRTGIEAPYLQLVMQRLWDVELEQKSSRLRAATLGALGGAPRIVADHLERAMAALQPGQRDLAAALFNQLVTPSGTKIAHGLEDLAEYVALPEEDLRPVVRALAGHRILRPDESGRYEIFHDVLAGEVLAWRTRHTAARAVEQTRADARRRHRRLGILTVVALAALAVMAAVSVFAFQQRDTARRQRHEAQRQEVNARREKARADTTAARERAARREAVRDRNAARAARKVALQQTAAAQAATKRADLQKTLAENQKRRAENQTAIARAALTAKASALRAAQAQKENADRQTRVAKRETARAEKATVVAHTQARFAKAGQLAETAYADLAIDPLRSVKLAVEAAQLQPASPRVEDVLRRALVASRVRAILPFPHGLVRGVAFNRDGSMFVVAGGHDGARLYRTATGGLVRTLERRMFVSAVAFSPDGRLIATADGDGHARLWRADDGTQVGSVYGGQQAMLGVSFSADGRFVVTAARDRTVRVWKTETLEPVAVFLHDAPVTGAAISPDGSRVVTVSGPPPGQLGPIQARLFDVAGQRLVSLLPERGITSAGFSPDGSLVATTSADRTSRLWRADSGTLVWVLPQPDGQVLDASFSSDGKRIVTAGKGATADVWDVATGVRQLVLVGPSNFIKTASFSPDGRFVLLASLDYTARIYAAESSLQVAVLAGHSDGVLSASFSPDGGSVVTTSSDGTARLWNPSTTDQLRLLGTHGGAVNAASFSKDGRLAVSAGSDGTARVWSIARRMQLRSFHHDAPVNDAAFSPDGTIVATASDDGTAGLWSLATGAEVQTLDHSGPVRRVTFSQDGRLVATASDDGTVRIWLVATGAMLQSLSQGSPATSVQFAYDGRSVATAGEDGVVRLWRPLTGQLLHTLHRHRGAVVRISFSHDDTLVATASADATARLWRVSDGTLIHTYRGHTQGLTDVEFSPDDRFLVTSSLDRDARLWDVRTGRKGPVLRGHFSSVQAASYSPDGRWIVTASQSSAGLWDASTGKLFSVSGSPTDPFLHGHSRPLTAAVFSPDGRIVLTASQDGTVRTYRCTLCGGVHQLLALARARMASLASHLDAAERRRYLG